MSLTLTLTLTLTSQVSKEFVCAIDRQPPSNIRRVSFDAIAIAEDSELLAETLGEQVFDFLLRNKRAEWDEYRGQVSAFERGRMLPVI